jgi:putative hydrolase of the HAD superfamily
VRARRISEATGADESHVARAFGAAWRMHQEVWHHRGLFAGPDMLRHTLHTLGVTLAVEAQARLLAQLEEDILDREVCAIDGARDLLAGLRAAGVRTALICDTGFTPGRVLRSLLARLGLLQHLEVAIFSDEIGVPKPHPRAFESALSALGTAAAGAVHVGDLRRSDVAGARAAGMTSVRFRGHHDDGGEGLSPSGGVIGCAEAGCAPPCARPEADIVIDSYAELGAWLAPRISR